MSPCSTEAASYFWILPPSCVGPYLNRQSESVSQNQHKHDVFELAGVDDFPEFELGWVFRNVDLYRLGLQRVINTLTLERSRRRTRLAREDKSGAATNVGK